MDFRAALKTAFDRRLSFILTSVNLYLISAALHPVAGTLQCISKDLRTEVCIHSDVRCQLLRASKVRAAVVDEAQKVYGNDTDGFLLGFKATTIPNLTELRSSADRIFNMIDNREG